MQTRKPTREQKILLKSRGLNPANWLVISDDKYRMIVMHRESTKHKTIVREEHDAC